MSLAKNYHHHPKLNRGPGGWRCSCCTMHKDMSKQKAFAHRTERRTAKMALRKEMNNQVSL